MSDQALILVDGQNVRIPRELFQAMENPKNVRIYPMTEPDVAKIEKYRIGRWANAKRLVYNRLNKRHEPLPMLMKLKFIDGNGATFDNQAKYDFRHRTFHIVNYHPGYYLMPTDALPESGSREQSWQHIQHYHEHLLSDLQDASANRVSQWLAEEIFPQFHPTSLLELGCGAGRNLLHIHRNSPGVTTTGVDINAEAIVVARKQLKGKLSTLLVGSMYDLAGFPNESFDVVFTSGVLMHTPGDRIATLIREMHRIARRAVIHFELDGPTHDFDYHRYPRDYQQVYRTLGMRGHITYQKFPPDDYRSNMTLPFCHALLVCKK